ncbi:CsiV family protein [Legionella sp. km772]|uniref:CsiV family protein n=1 Tax=Legionella sp. km772 TaxID=2498111 RepID=UPI000F8C777F|nr:CsiV family protein [Legionella sp. km772]RUR13888.1 hypothetical protein ELY15_01105 [Legionella sp. km772]
MYRVILALITLIYCGLSLAKGTYQIDLILFAHPQNTNELQDLHLPFLPIDKKALTLTSSTIKTAKLYTLLPPSQSSLHDEYYLLNRKSQFRVLAQYSWRQSAKKQEKVALPRTNNKGWLMQGTIQVEQGSYYSFDARLQFSPPSDPSAAFTVSQKQRIEEGKIYYLDNPYVGMVVKIQQVG